VINNVSPDLTQIKKLIIVHFEEGPSVTLGTRPKLCMFSSSSTMSCSIRSSMPMLDKASNKASHGASYSNLFTMLLQLHPIKCPTPTQRSLSLVSILKVFGIENSMIVVPKKCGEY